MYFSLIFPLPFFLLFFYKHLLCFCTRDTNIDNTVSLALKILHLWKRHVKEIITNNKVKQNKIRPK